MTLRALPLGVAAVLVVAVGVPIVVTRHHSAAATVPVAPLSATDRRVLSTSRPLITALPNAIAQLPIAASDASAQKISPAQARQILNQTTALEPLARAIAAPTTLTGPLTAGYESVLAGHRPDSPDQLASSLETLQTVEGDVVPAVRVVATRGGHSLSAAAALSAIERDPRTRSLADLVAGWQEEYGAFVLVEQSAAG
jgi:hypothetical protein